LPDFEGLVSVSTDKDDFVKKIIIETSDDTPKSIKKRIEFASGNSWEARTESFGNIIEKMS
jgi:hypothetical protein